MERLVAVELADRAQKHGAISAQIRELEHQINEGESSEGGSEGTRNEGCAERQGGSDDEGSASDEGSVSDDGSADSSV